VIQRALMLRNPTSDPEDSISHTHRLLTPSSYVYYVAYFHQFIIYYRVYNSRCLHTLCTKIESVTFKTTRVRVLKEFSYCYHGNYQRQMHRFSHESHLSKPLLHVTSLICSWFPSKTTRVLDSCYFSTT
jgi:hypothetical protein